MNQPTCLQNWASIFQIATGVLTVVVLFFSLKTTHRLKTTDVRLEQQRKFDTLLLAKHSLQTKWRATREDVMRYCERFWNHQADQFDDWYDGLLSDDTFRSWIDNRRQEWLSNPVLAAGMTYREGWNGVKDDFLKKREFKGFMEIVTDPDQGVDEALKKYRRNILIRLLRRVSG